MEDSHSKKQKTKGGATSSSFNPSTRESVNTGDDGGSLEGSTRRKAAKERARKSKIKLSDGDNSSSTYFMKLFEEMKEEKKMLTEKKIEFMEKLYLQEQEKLAHDKEKIQLEQMKEEQKIMLMDTSVMPPIQAEYFKRRQMEIMGKKM